MQRQNMSERCVKTDRLKDRGLESGQERERTSMECQTWKVMRT